MVETMFDDEIYIRNEEERIAFTYTIRRSGKLVESEQVDADESVAPGYYGGSDVMD